VMVGNGNLGFPADITGLQTFQEQYSPRVPLMIQAQWAWHSFPNPAGFSLGIPGRRSAGGAERRPSAAAVRERYFDGAPR
jgi:hypothetical protein